MNKTLWIAIGIIVIIVGGLYVWRTYTGVPLVTPSIAVTSPQGGEAWVSGSIHTLSWTTQGIPSTDKVSVTIRRVPPPPLPEEGQEFDPIIFTDLPNTGSTTWTISNTYPSGTYVLGISAYHSVPVTNPVSVETKPFTIVHPKLAIDLYPLYPKASWNDSEVESITIGTTTYTGASMTSTTIDAGMDPGSVFTPFTKYYDNLLASHGWHVANDLAAGGHTGGQEGYQNGNGTILVGFNIDYQTKPENAPSECPCTVTLSLFSSGATN